MRRSVAKFFYAVFSRKSPATASSPMVSRRQRRGLLPLHRAPVLDLQQRQVPKLSLQLSHGGAASSKDGSRVIINDRRVWTRMVAITLRFTVCSCLYRGAECVFGSVEAARERPSLARIRPNTDLSRCMLRPIARPHLYAGRLSQLAAPVCRAASASARSRGRRRSHLARAYRSPPRYRETSSRSRPPASHNCSASVRAALSRRRRPHRSPSL